MAAQRAERPPRQPWPRGREQWGRNVRRYADRARPSAANVPAPLHTSFPTRRLASSRTSLLAVLVALIIGAAVVGCGDDGGTTAAGPVLSAAELTAKAEAACAKASAIDDPVLVAQQRNQTGEAVKRAFAARAATLRTLSHDLGRLSPPKASAGAYEKLVAALGDYASGLDDLADNVKQSQGVDDVLQATPGVVDRLNKLATSAGTNAAKLNLLGCLLSG